MSTQVINFTSEQLIAATKAYVSMSRKRSDTESYLKAIFQWEPALTAATLDEIERQLNVAPQTAVAVAEPEPVWEKPSHEEIPLHELDPEALGLDPFLNEGDVQLSDAILEAKRKKNEFDPLPLAPALLKSLPNWVTYESADNKAPKISGTTDNAKSNDPTTWVTYGVTCKNIQKGKGCTGLGFVTDGANSHNLVGFDFDGCRNPETGELTPWAVRLLEALGQTYGEVTVSSTGLRFWVIAPLGKNIKFKMGLSPLYCGKNQKLEIFGDGLYFTVSGNRLAGLPSEILTLDAAKMGELLALAHSLAVEAPKPEKVRGAFTPEPDEGFRRLFDSVGWKPFVDRMNKMADTRFHNLTIDAGKMTYCPMPQHQPRSTSMKYTPCFGALADESAVIHCFGCDFSGDMVKAVFEFDAGEDGGRVQYKNMYECARAVCSECGLNFEEFFPDKSEKTERVDTAALAGEIQQEQVVTQTEMDAELEKPYPVITLPPSAGPAWDDSILYGRVGAITKRAVEYSESHPAGVYLDLLTSIGNACGRNAYFRVNHTAHFTNEFLVRVGPTSRGRKGGGRDIVDAIMALVDFDWVASRTMSGFGSGEAVIHQMRDSNQQQVRDRGKSSGFKTITVPGVADKRLCVRAGEIAGTFEVASRDGSLMSVILRDGWDGKTLSNKVKGTTEGISNSTTCKEPHLSVSGDCTKEELIAKMPDNSAENGFGNRFIYCYVTRTKLCPQGGPEIDWSADAAYLQEVIAFAKGTKYVALDSAAEKMWNRMYVELDQQVVPGLAGSMTARAAAHIRRLALIFALVDLSAVVKSKHLKAARDIWDYCQQSAEYIFSGMTRDQARIVRFVEKKGTTTDREVCDEMFHRHQKMAWVRAQIDDLVRSGQLVRNGDSITKK